MKALVLFIGLMLTGISWSQDVNTILTKVNTSYSNKNVSYSTRYELFKGHQSTNLHSFYVGEVVSHNGSVYQKIDKTEFVYTENFSVKINSDEKALVVLPGREKVSPELDLELALSDCASSKVIDKGSFYRIVLTMKPESSLQCSEIKLEVNKDNFTLNQIDIYYSFLQDFSTVFSQQDLNQPHMRIKFSNVNLEASGKDKLFSQTTYYSLNNGGLIPAGNYAAYTLHDNR